MTNVQKHAKAATQHLRDTNYFLQYTPTYFLVSCESGKVLFKGSKEQCLEHPLNNSMTLILNAENAAEYSASFNR